MEWTVLLFFFLLFGGGGLIQRMYVRTLEHRERLAQLHIENTDLRGDLQELEKRCQDLEERVEVLETIATGADSELDRQFQRLEGEAAEEIRLRGQ